MASVNDCTFIGNLGKDPDVRYDPAGKAVVNFTLACNEHYKDKAGVRQEKTEWINVVCFERNAEFAAEYLKKGNALYVRGRMQTRKWTGKDGQERWTTEIVADRIQSLTPKGQGEYVEKNRPAKESAPDVADIEDDIPF